MTKALVGVRRRGKNESLMMIAIILFIQAIKKTTDSKIMAREHQCCQREGL
jgi:hypothetical protein